MPRPSRNPAVGLAGLVMMLALAGCGGGGVDDGGPDAVATVAPQAVAAPSVTATSAVDTDTAADPEPARANAASATARSSRNACAAIRPFYWEIGDAQARRVGGAVAGAAGSPRFDAKTPIAIASASKWIYGAFVAQQDNGVLSATDRKFLSMRSGYVSLKRCGARQTVDGCLARDGNGSYTPSADGKFDYDGAHLEKHASLNGLGGYDREALAAVVRGQLGADVALRYSSPQLAGGLVMAPADYARVLRKMLAGDLRLGALLGSGKVCTNARTCGAAKAVYAPIPASESWHYSVAHWVEDDPKVGDGAFSSPGAFGFYPWIDAAKSSYGVVARVADHGAWASVQCGRLIRRAWATGVAQ